MNNHNLDLSKLPNPLKLDESKLSGLVSAVKGGDKITAMHMIRKSPNYSGLAIAKEYIDSLAQLLEEDQD